MKKLIDFDKIFNHHDKYKEKEINQERITYKEVHNLIQRYKKSNLFNVEKAGESIEMKEIYSLTIGNGSRKILVWSQMHGDEPTATAALFDLFNFFCDKDEYDFFRKEILRNLQILFIPMLNPDGAEKHNRENKISLDINRDSLKRVSPEAKVLWKAALTFNPEFAFNLHDQNCYYTAGRIKKTSAISMLAPPYNYNNSINPARTKSMQLIASINKNISRYIPGQIARYKDDHEPRSFGDAFIGNGISSLLIESGFIIGDNKKEVIRKLNFMALISAFNSIITADYEQMNENEYYSIPENETLLFDLLLRNLHTSANGKDFKIDLGINREKKYQKETGTFFYKGKIAAIGDLENYFGIEEHNLSSHTVKPGSVFNCEYKSLPSANEIINLLKNGYCSLKLDPFSITFLFVERPINVVPSYIKYEPLITVDEFANLSIFHHNEIKFIVVNGFFSPVENYPNSILNGVVIS
ncbi:MAG: M14 family zinc carboxypeptidase [Bacteroidota bacterium]